jgi:hypothetical protein
MPPSAAATPAVVFRPATAADQRAITAIIRQAGINPLSLKWPNFLLAVEAGAGEVVGTGQLTATGAGSWPPSPPCPRTVGAASRVN